MTRKEEREMEQMKKNNRKNDEKGRENEEREAGILKCSYSQLKKKINENSK